MEGLIKVPFPRLAAVTTRRDSGSRMTNRGRPILRRKNDGNVAKCWLDSLLSLCYLGLRQSWAHEGFNLTLMLPKCSQFFYSTTEAPLPLPDACEATQRKLPSILTPPPQLKFETCLPVIPEREMSAISVRGRKRKCCCCGDHLTSENKFQ